MTFLHRRRNCGRSRGPSLCTSWPSVCDSALIIIGLGSVDYIVWGGYREEGFIYVAIGTPSSKVNADFSVAAVGLLTLLEGTFSLVLYTETNKHTDSIVI